MTYGNNPLSHLHTVGISEGRIRDGWLHWNLDDRRLVAIREEDIWRRAQPLQMQGASTLVLSPEDTLLFLSNHLTKEADKLLKPICDITELLKKYDGNLDWDYIIKSARVWEVEAAVYFALRWSQELLGAPVPPSAIEILKPRAWRRWLLEFLVNREFFIAESKPTRLRDEIYTMARSLMMKHRHGAVLVFTKNHGDSEKGFRPRTAFWIALVLSAALGRNIAKFISGFRPGAS